MSETDTTSELSPRNNPDLVGQDAAEAAFLSAWRSGRVAHAWLISGPRGVGKATFAFRVARFVLAGGAGDSLVLPAAHPTFRRVAAGSHSDLMVLQPGMMHPDTKKETREIVVGHVRAATEFLTRTSGEGGWRVAIVDTAEAMNRNAANALLKILEEPPAQCLVLLTSSAPGRLLATIRSRCRQLKLPPLDDAVVARLLARYRPGERDAAALAALSGGSIGRAMELADLGGIELQGQLDALLERLPALDIPGVHGFAERLARPPKGAPEGGFALALELLAERAAVRARGGAAVESWLAVWDKIGQLQNRVDAVNLDRKLVLLEAFLAIAAAARGTIGQTPTTATRR